MEILATQAPRALAARLRALQRELRSGSSADEALARHLSLDAAVIRDAMATGRLGPTLTSFAHDLFH